MIVNTKNPGVLYFDDSGVWISQDVLIYSGVKPSCAHDSFQYIKHFFCLSYYISYFRYICRYPFVPTCMISFEVKDVDLPGLDFSKIRKWLDEIASGHDRSIGNINYLFCNDEEILRVNREFLHHDYYTDIITFDYSHKNRMSGDIFISLDTVRSNSEVMKVPYISELLRVMAHGLLHLCGIGDKGEGEREIMEAHENRALDIWPGVEKADR